MSLFARNRYPKHLADELTVRQQLGIFIWEVCKIVVISLVIIVPVRYFLIKPFYVKGASMEPNFHDYEYLIIDEISYRFGHPQRGDVVVFRYPLDPRQFFIKRVIGLPGETIQIDNGEVTVLNQQYPDGIILDEPYLEDTVKTSGSIDVTLGANEYYLLGDNRPSSLDSRVFGPVTRDHIVGQTLLRGWPFNRVGILTGPVEYNL